MKGITLSSIKNSIPKECFKKSLRKSLGFFFLDVAMIAFSYTVLIEIVSYSQLLYFTWCIFTGFFMWNLFVVGHDCGHSTFSNYTLINDFVGHLCHTPLLVPFWPWQLSHHRHHLHHNNIKKDHSYPWMTKGSLQRNPVVVRMTQFVFLFPWTLYSFFYLVIGFPDGSHYWPFSKLFSTKEERLKCCFSSLLCVTFLLSVYNLIGSFYGLFFYYLVPIGFFSFFLVMVTFLQHHAEGAHVYSEKDWSFIKGALETNDRTYGWPMDFLMHNITDGHIVHHLFFREIPHYNLAKATKYLYKHLDEKGIHYRNFKEVPYVGSVFSYYSTVIFHLLLNKREDLVYFL